MFVQRVILLIAQNVVRTQRGYYIYITSCYFFENSKDDYVMLLKYHSSVPSENGSIYYGDMFFMDLESGTSLIDLNDKNLTISAEDFHTKTEVQYKIQKTSSDIIINNRPSVIYVGEK